VGADYNQMAFCVTSAASAAAGMKTTVTFSAAFAVGNTAIRIYQVNGGSAGTWSFDKWGPNNGNSSAVASAAITTTSPNEFIAAWSGVDNHITPGTGSFTLNNPSGNQDNNQTGAGLDVYGDNGQYKIVSSIQTNLQWTATQAGSAAKWAAAIVSFAFTASASTIVYPTDAVFFGMT
jgi:hypothetical protein